MSTTFFNDVDFTVIFPSMLALVIVTTITPLITLVVVVVRIVVLVAAIKIVVLTTVATVVIAVWGVVRAWNPCHFFNDYLFGIIGVRIFLAVARSAVTDSGLLRRSLSLRASWKRRPVMKALIASLLEIDGTLMRISEKRQTYSCNGSSL
jgi:hypothetical protein